MRDLEYLRQEAELPSLIVYRYRTEPLRRAVRGHIQRALAARGRTLVSCEPNDFVMRLGGGGFFSSAGEAPFLDWSIFPNRSSPILIDETDDGAESDLELGSHHFGLKSILHIARKRPSNSPTAVMFIDAMDKSAEHWGPEQAPGEIHIEGAASVGKADIPLLVDALSAGLSRAEVTELRSVAFAAWSNGSNFATLCDDVETAAVCTLTKRKSGPRGAVLAPHPTVRVPLSALRELVFGKQQTRLNVVSSLLKPHGSGGDALRELVVLTIRLLPVPGCGPVRDLDAHRWVNWLAVLLRHAEALWSVGDRTGSMWPKPDRRAPVVFQMLEEFQHAHDRALLGWRPHEPLIETGARWLATTLPDLSDRIGQGLRQLKPSSIEGSSALGVTVSDFSAKIEHWLRNEAVEGTTIPAKEPTAPQLTAFSELVGQAGVKFIFLQPFDERKGDERAYARPLLLVGPDGVGKRVVASLMGRLFICETATAASPIVCGKCEGCSSADMRIVDADATDLSDVNSTRAFVKERMRNRGTLLGSPVTIIHHVDRLVEESSEEILKTIESAFGAGLKIFTARDRMKVHDALRSRCLVVHCWPLRHDSGCDFEPCSIIAK